MKPAFKNIYGRGSIVMLAAVAVPAMARPAMHVDFRNAGYRGGYQDNRHHWHHWSYRSDAVAYRSRYQQDYRDMNFREDYIRAK